MNYLFEARARSLQVGLKFEKAKGCEESSENALKYANKKQRYAVVGHNF